MSEEEKTVENLVESSHPGAPMPLFSSGRERRLWGCAMVVVVAIYSTLGLGAGLVVAMRDRGLLDASFVLGFLLVLATIVTQGLKRRPGGSEIGVALGVAAAFLMMFVRMGIPAAERTHLIEYGVVAVFVYEALTERVSQGRYVPVPAVLAILVTVLLGMLDECIQAFLPDRVFDPRDILFNLLAGTMAVLASLTLAWARRRNV